jgi:hypothetical protein
VCVKERKIDRARETETETHRHTLEFHGVIMYAVAVHWTS